MNMMDIILDRNSKDLETMKEIEKQLNDSFDFLVERASTTGEDAYVGEAKDCIDQMRRLKKMMKATEGSASP